MQTYEFDTVILGGGPAGLSAGVYSARNAMNTAIVDINMFGGQPANYLEIENYPGYSAICACELAEKFEEHADKFGVKKFPMKEIISADLVSETKTITANDAVFKAKSVIIATGTKPKKTGVPGEEEFFGRGVSYCAVCDGAFYKDKTVAVVGGGNSALEEACYLTKFASKVYLIHRRDEFRADKIVTEKVLSNPKIEILQNTCIKEIKGQEHVTSAVLMNVKTDAVNELNLDGIFLYIGSSPNTELFAGQLALDSRGFIVTDETMKTSVPGVFAAGDVRVTPLRQVITAAADGAIAAVYAAKYAETVDKLKV